MRYFIHFVFLAIVGGCGPVSCLAYDVETKTVTRCSTYANKQEMLNRFSIDSMMMYLSDGWRMQKEGTRVFHNEQADEVCVLKMFSRPRSLF